MKTIVRDFSQVILIIITVAVGPCLAQQAAPEKHLKHIAAEQSQDVILASALCQKVRADGGHLFSDFPKVNPVTLEADLSALMQKSDEVVLATAPKGLSSVLSPSGADVITNYEVEVLRTWKGSHKIGDLLTFAMPLGIVECKSEQVPNTLYTVGKPDWEGKYLAGPYVLFLRQSRGGETQLMPGLRLAGGSGLQGLFYIRPDSHYGNYCSFYSPSPTSADRCDTACGVQRCNTALHASPFHVSVRYRLDPLKRKYDGMPVPSFLNEVQSVADSLGYTGQAPTTK
jgi:hypothetical protein